MLRALLSREFPRVAERKVCCLARVLSRVLALRSPHTRTSSRPSQVSPRERTRQKPRRQVSKAVSESAADYADRSISRSNESTDILIIFYRLVTTRLWQPSNGTGGRPSGREDNRRGKGRGASDRIRDIQRERERLRVIFTMARVEIAIGFAARG